MKMRMMMRKHRKHDNRMAGPSQGDVRDATVCYRQEKGTLSGALSRSLHHLASLLSPFGEAREETRKLEAAQDVKGVSFLDS